ncbi:inositol monophosphatase family protein [Granulosicoccus antarcticus]|uniref:Nus factor SuhB n=1 Tax=Granulosicoccus antarcticus IMCC3135 TaxID=1192854 RepID=A0A2Z2P7N0_9GAMM|nr:inositol monophosphatase [Granulosicoccus antarcticus]ASJ75844.1 Inositol-1-monophosphatase [Granulosicoccus antarcticus IMCC3135]
MSAVAARLEFAKGIVAEAAQSALTLFHDRDNLDIEVKGLQDWVSNADKSVEDQIRAAIGDSFPDDSIVGEEHDNVTGSSGFTWVIDPIDGTTNFVNGTPGWCVVLACVQNDQTVCAVICDPVSNENYTGQRGQGAFLNGRRLQAHAANSLSDGTLGVGHNSRIPPEPTLTLLTQLLNRQGLFRRGGSGALDLAYVAAGRLIGYVEPHMNAWDCLASLLFIEEAGGKVEAFNMQHMLEKGGRVITAGPGIYNEVASMVETAYGPKSTEQ